MTTSARNTKGGVIAPAAHASSAKTVEKFMECIKKSFTASKPIGVK